MRVLPPDALQWLWVILGPLLVVCSFFLVLPALVSKGPVHGWHWRPSVLFGILVPMFNYNLLGGPLFEEFGWRGFLQARLQYSMQPWLAAMLWALSGQRGIYRCFFCKGGRVLHDPFTC
jgi:membrane protease YdiL (CAAX protease family)